ncbi:hypothetical protein Neosp_001488 [[Neocosmospora] mangrovei]
MTALDFAGFRSAPAPAPHPAPRMFKAELSLANNYGCEATNYAKPLRDLGLRSDNDLRGLIKAGHCYVSVDQVPSRGHDLTTVSAQEPTLERLDIDLESDGPASIERHPSSAVSNRSSRKGISLDAHVLDLSELYERSLSLESEPEPADGPGSQNTPARPSKKRKKLSGDVSNGGGKGSQDTEKGRDKQGAGGEDDGGNEDGRSGGGGSSQPAKDLNKEKHRRWICPYSIAYPDLCENPMFSYCLPGNMTDMHLWK